MEETVAMFPVLPGKTNALLAFVDALNGERLNDFNESQVTVQMERWYLQHTPFGDFVLAQFSAPSIANVFVGLATADDEFAVWYRTQILEITGIDLSNPPSSLPERIFDWKRE